MCRICGSTPCNSRCPNAPDPEPIKICSECGEGIYEGEEYFDSDFGPICKDCMADKSLTELLEVFGEKMTVAEVA